MNEPPAVISWSYCVLIQESGIYESGLLERNRLQSDLEVREIRETGNNVTDNFSPMQNLPMVKCSLPYPNLHSHPQVNLGFLILYLSNYNSNLLVT